MKLPVLIAGWFSYDECDATLGDRMALDVLTQRLRSEGIDFVVHYGSAQPNGDYLAKIWLTGPFDYSYPRQSGLVGSAQDWIIANATLIDDRATPQAANLSFLRDGNGIPTKGDFAFVREVAQSGRYAVLMLRGYQPEYRMLPDSAEELARVTRTVLERSGYWVVPVTTRAGHSGRLGEMTGGLEHLIRGANIVITSRLHGIVHSLNAGKIPIIIDEVLGGGKVSAAADLLGLPVHAVERLSQEAAFSQLLSDYEAQDGLETTAIRELGAKSANESLGRLIEHLKALRD